MHHCLRWRKILIHVNKQINKKLKLSCNGHGRCVRWTKTLRRAGFLGLKDKVYMRKHKLHRVTRKQSSKCFSLSTANMPMPSHSLDQNLQPSLQGFFLCWIIHVLIHQKTESFSYTKDQDLRFFTYEVGDEDHDQTDLERRMRHVKSTTVEETFVRDVLKFQTFQESLKSTLFDE